MEAIFFNLIFFYVSRNDINFKICDFFHIYLSNGIRISLSLYQSSIAGITDQTQLLFFSSLFVSDQITAESSQINKNLGI